MPVFAELGVYRMWTEGIVIAILSLVGTLVGAYLSSQKTTALVVYRLEQLEKKVEKHNNIVERVYNLEESVKLLDQKVAYISKDGDDDGK